MTSKEYWEEFDKTLNDDDEKKILNDNKEEINRMVRQYGRGYIEEIITIRRLQQDETLMEDTRKYVVEVVKHIMLAIDEYNREHSNDAVALEDPYTKYLLVKKKSKSSETKNELGGETFDIMKSNNFANVSICELMEMIYNFKSTKVLSKLKYSGVNIHYKKYLQNLHSLLFGYQYEMNEKTYKQEKLLKVPYYMSCFMNKKVLFKDDYLNNCTSAIDNNNYQEFNILFGEKLFEVPYCRKIISDITIGRTEVIPDKKNKYYEYALKNNKTYISGYSGTTLSLIYLLLIFDIQGYTYKQQIFYSLLGIINRISTVHHSIHEIFSVINMLVFPNKTTSILEHIFKYEPKEHYFTTMKKLKTLLV